MLSQDRTVVKTVCIIIESKNNNSNIDMLMLVISSSLVHPLVPVHVLRSITSMLHSMLCKDSITLSYMRES
jgi:hypothetical protein